MTNEEKLLLDETLESAEQLGKLKAVLQCKCKIDEILQSMIDKLKIERIKSHD